ncbi:MAG: hypothetical protein WCP69_08420 [Bacteroidota bacterium]|jgi:hypothetical protein
MNIGALITMVIVHVSVTAFTVYYFYKVLVAKPKSNSLDEDNEA